MPATFMETRPDTFLKINISSLQYLLNSPCAGKGFAAFATNLYAIQLSAQHYKFGNNNNNELLIINLISVRVTKILIPVLPGLNRWLLYELPNQNVTEKYKK